MRTGYWDWTARAQDGPHYLRYCGTPPVPHLYGLREALAMLDEEGAGGGVGPPRGRWPTSCTPRSRPGRPPDGLELNIVDPAARSNAVTTILTGGIDADRLRGHVRGTAPGLTLGVGLGPFERLAFRIGHMGHLNPPMVLGTLGTIEAALIAMDAPMGGSGVAAAAATAGRAFATVAAESRCQTADMPTYLIVNSTITDQELLDAAPLPRSGRPWRAMTRRCASPPTRRRRSRERPPGRGSS